jgi:hypothetical protein
LFSMNGLALDLAQGLLSAVNGWKAQGVRAHARWLKQRPDVGSAAPAGPAGEARLEIRQPDVIRPAVRADHDRVAAAIVRTVDQQAAHTLRARVIFCGCADMAH